MGFLSTNLVSKFVVHLIWLLLYCIFRIQAQKKERCCPWRFIQLCFNCYPTIHIYPFVCFPFTHAHSLLLVNFALHICRLAKFTLYMSKEKVVAFLEAYWLSIWLVLAFMLFLLLICDDWCPCPEVFLMFFCVSISCWVICPWPYTSLPHCSLRPHNPVLILLLMLLHVCLRSQYMVWY